MELLLPPPPQAARKRTIRATALRNVLYFIMSLNRVPETPELRENSISYSGYSALASAASTRAVTNSSVARALVHGELIAGRHTNLYQRVSTDLQLIPAANVMAIASS